MPKKVSVIIPTYNEAGNVVDLVNQITRVIPTGWEYEVIVVDDNSPDGTYTVISNAFRGNPVVISVLRTTDRGFAKSIRAGIERSTGDRIVVMDADFTHDPVEIPSLFNRLVLMSTNAKSWHSVNEVKTDGIRRCISNYYFSPHSPNGYETTHVTYFQARPEQTLRRIVTKVDSDLRTVLRKIKKSGFSKKDLYEGEKNK